MAAPVFAAAATAFEVIGTVASGRQAEAVGNYNAAQLEEQGRFALQSSSQRAALQRQRSREALSTQRVAMVQNGLDPTSGTAAFVTEQSMRDAELDALQQEYEGLMQARGYDAQAAVTRAEGKFKKRQANLSAVGKIIGATGSYLSGTKGPRTYNGDDDGMKFSRTGEDIRARR